LMWVLLFLAIMDPPSGRLAFQTEGLEASRAAKIL